MKEATDKQKALIIRLFLDLGVTAVTTELHRRWIESNSLDDITFDQASELIDDLKGELGWTE